MVGTREIDTPPVIPRGVTVIESASHSTVMAAWERALFGVFPSIWPEPYGNVVHEAMSAGRAVIGTRPGGHADLVNNDVDGVLVDAGSEPQLAEAMQRLIDEPALRDALGEQARRKAARFTTASAMDRFIALYDTLIDAAGHSPRSLQNSTRT